jgi:hypothetical protein
MRIARSLALATAVVAIWSQIPQSDAKAQGPDPYCTGGFPYPTWGGYWDSPYATDRIPTPPYFAIHPPVYYSYPFPRTYGYSPYAYPGTIETPQIEIERPAVIENPHTSDKKLKRDQRERTASTQKEIINPFASVHRQGSDSLAVTRK